MTPGGRLAEVFDRGLRDGLDTLTPVERDLFRIQDFIIEFEMSGLSGYLYNRLPNQEDIRAAIGAMRQYGLSKLADLANKAAELFTGYTDPDPPAAWVEVLRHYDPGNRLGELEERIRAIDNYGLAEASIV